MSDVGGVIWGDPADIDPCPTKHRKAHSSNLGDRRLTQTGVGIDHPRHLPGSCRIHDGRRFRRPFSPRHSVGAQLSHVDLLVLFVTVNAGHLPEVGPRVLVPAD